MDGAYESASAIQPGLLFVPNTPVRITIVQDATNLIFSLRGSAKGRPTETVEVYFDGKRPTMPTAPFFTGLKSLDGKTMEYIKNAFDILP